MRIETWKKISLMTLIAGVFIVALPSWTAAQDNFREFDRKMVATPAELFEVLSMLRPSEQRKLIDARRQRKIEEAGRKFLSELTPEGKEKALEFAEKFLRKNGANSTSSQKLMEQFGLPTELQKEILEQFRKHGNQQPNSDSGQNAGESDDAIRQLLQKAREKFNAASPDKLQKADRPSPTNPGEGSKPDANSDQDGIADSQLKSKPDPELKKPEDSKLKERNSELADQIARKLGNKTDAQAEQRKQDLDNKRTDLDEGKDKNWKPLTPRSSSRTNKADRDKKNRRDTKRSQKNNKDKTNASDADLDRLLGQLEGFRKNNKDSRKSDNNADRKQSFPQSDLDWEKVIKDLAEKGTTTEGSNPSKGTTANPITGSGGTLDPATADRAMKLLKEMTSDDRIDRSRIKQANDVLSRSIKSRKKADDSDGWDQWNANSDERPANRFDRLLVKAAERTLASKNDDSSVSKSVGSVFGNLIERIQQKATQKKEDRDQSANRNSNNQKQAGNQNESSNNDRRAEPETRSTNSQSSSTPSSQDSTPFQGSSPSADSSSFDPGKILDSIPDLSAINPTHIFTCFAIIGLIFFVGYLLAQSLTGNGAAVSKRKVIQQIRNTQMKSPKDLIETVDVFLLSKFGIKSSWWNAGLVQNVLTSNSPELQTRVNELIQNYIRARYMRDDTEISSADQQRFKKTLEELSMIDIKPRQKIVTASLALSSPAPAPTEG